MNVRAALCLQMWARQQSPRGHWWGPRAVDGPVSRERWRVPHRPEPEGVWEECPGALRNGASLLTWKPSSPHVTRHLTNRCRDHRGRVERPDPQGPQARWGRRSALGEPPPGGSRRVSWPQAPVPRFTLCCVERTCPPSMVSPPEKQGGSQRRRVFWISDVSW